MTYSIRSSGALAVLWLAALVATPAFGQSKAADPADPNATVPPTRYVPIPAAPAAVHAAAPASTPAQNWKAANGTVASYDSMALTMEMAASAVPAPAGPGSAPAPAAPAVPAPAAPAVPARAAPAVPAPPAQAVPAPAPDAHAHHMHMEGK